MQGLIITCWRIQGVKYQVCSMLKNYNYIKIIGRILRTSDDPTNLHHHSFCKSFQAFMHPESRSFFLIACPSLCESRHPCFCCGNGCLHFPMACKQVTLASTAKVAAARGRPDEAQLLGYLVYSWIHFIIWMYSMYSLNHSQEMII